MRAFGAPYSMTMLELDSVGMFDSAVEAAGKVFLSTELGGGGSATAASIAIAERGVRRVLVHCRRLRRHAGAAADASMLDMPDGSCYTTCLR